MRVAYLDCLSGVSGDMVLGAMVDAGVDLAAIQAGIDSLGLPTCRLEVEEVKRQGFRAAKVHVRAEPEHKHRHLHHITEMIEQSKLTLRQRELSVAIFTRLGEAEARVHGSTLQKVHFHEVGAVDSIADIVGTAIGWDLLQADRLVCSPVPTGTGFIQIAHGRVSVPAPATAELLRGIPLAASDLPFELTTPTGAAIVATLADHFGPLPEMAIQQIGYGAGDRDMQRQANILRLLLGETSGVGDQDQITVLETNLDDVSGEVIGYCLEQLWRGGALDVYTTAITMKKNRPATKITVLCAAEKVESLQGILAAETLTLGVRRWDVRRSKLQRSQVTVTTAWGPVAGKQIRLAQGELVFTPEYEACRALAEQHQQPFWKIYEAARAQFASSQ